ncbi:hypothetical protein DAEQUDRAFT_93975 [Daedalea quercina L-15889]|uniref:Uncharacterized protein n=1 Tax=Daedalea quercina L-15889 TaxID=1314783 RepID=A0A165S9S4_9APHY|nr:hypothetical protein DAEQUDRAFT_93975 [Daedalea quercina L-15889]
MTSSSAISRRTVCFPIKARARRSPRVPSQSGGPGHSDSTRCVLRYAKRRREPDASRRGRRRVSAGHVRIMYMSPGALLTTSRWSCAGRPLPTLGLERSGGGDERGGRRAEKSGVSRSDSACARGATCRDERGSLACGSNCAWCALDGRRLGGGIAAAGRTA